MGIILNQILNTNFKSNFDRSDHYSLVAFLRFFAAGSAMSEG
jgi:hypothetical protein